MAVKSDAKELYMVCQKADKPATSMEIWLQITWLYICIDTALLMFTGNSCQIRYHLGLRSQLRFRGTSRRPKHHYPPLMYVHCKTACFNASLFVFSTVWQFCHGLPLGLLPWIRTWTILEGILSVFILITWPRYRKDAFFESSLHTPLHIRFIATPRYLSFSIPSRKLIPQILFKSDISKTRRQSVQ